jgi:C-3',4' desaturase CrtD
MKRVVVIGAGIGGLSSAAFLAKSGLDVHVLESHIYPGGCASTFYHQGYQFDAGATLAAGFYPGGPMDLLGRAVGIDRWPTVPSDPTMVVQLPGGYSIKRLSGKDRWLERQKAFGNDSMKFWQWQEQTADAVWQLALRDIPWPPQNIRDFQDFISKGIGWIGEDTAHLRPELALDAIRPLSHHLKDASQKLRLFIDAQLLISAQTTSPHANALYGAAALDLPRRGAVHVKGGMIAIANTLVDVLLRNGGQIHYRQEATRIIFDKGRIMGVETRSKDTFPADLVIANLTPWNIAQLIPEHNIPRLRKLPERPKDGWGAFMVYVGLDGSSLPASFPLHHQIVLKEPYGEGNTLFLSLSPAWDSSRAPEGQRALTISTHTQLEPWWEAFQQDKNIYQAQKQNYVERVLSNANAVIPGLRGAANLILPGTPITFQRFTQRKWGWVGGFPQTHLFRSWGPQLAPGLWMVGDSIFPGQSAPAVALGGLRVAKTVLELPQSETASSKSNATRNHLFCYRG